MKISKKLQKLVDQGLISQEQAEQITLSDQSGHSNLVWKVMFGIAALLIGLGVILIVSANWRNIPDPVKLLGDFAIWGGILCATYWSVVNKKERIKELFLLLSFLFVAATIGLIAQIFHLSGGWHSFAITWAVLGLPFVLFSRLMTVNILWLWLVISTLEYDFWKAIMDMFDHAPRTVLVVGTLVLAALSYTGRQIYNLLGKIIVLPKAFSRLSFWAMYWFALGTGASLGFRYVFANIFVFVFLGIQLLLAVSNKNMTSFTRNAHLAELYILFLFFTRYGNLFNSGLGFIFVGCVLLGALYGLKKTSKYIKTMEVFHE